MGEARREKHKTRAAFWSAALLAASLHIAACTAVHPPAPYLPSRASITPGPSVTVRGNQNIYAIARANDVSMRDIIVLNDLRAPFALKPGQKLVLPTNSAKPSSTRLADDGQGPGDYASSVVATSSRLPPSSLGAGVATTAVEQADLPPLLPTQKPAAEHPASGAPTPTASAAGPENILRLPSSPAVPFHGSANPVNTYTGNNAGRMTPEPESASVPVPAPSPTPAPAPAASPVISPAATGVFTPSPTLDAADSAEENHEENQSVSLVWPVQGPLLSSFGPKGQGLSNDGLNISAPKGSPVVAAASGIVVYAGNEIKGFGNLVLIRHQGGWVTAYAHLDRAMVNKDTIVAQGDMIGTVGKTGNVPSPQLHFEVRSHGKPVNPEEYLKGNPPEKATQG